MNAIMGSSAMRVLSAEKICVNSSFHCLVNHAAQFSVYQILSAEIRFVSDLLLLLVKRAIL